MSLRVGAFPASARKPRTLAVPLVARCAIAQIQLMIGGCR